MLFPRESALEEFKQTSINNRTLPIDFVLLRKQKCFLVEWIVYLTTSDYVRIPHIAVFCENGVGLSSATIPVQLANQLAICVANDS